ncbi:MAG: alpha/beta hydrolase, partial [Alphaproteobacteria bacterium]
AADLPADLLKGAVSVSGIYDLTPIRLSYQQEVVRLDDEAVRTCSPIRRIAAPCAAPVICAVGSEETEEFLRQQNEFVTAWRTGGGEARVVDLPGRNHFSAVDALGETDHSLHAATCALASAGA